MSRVADPAPAPVPRFRLSVILRAMERWGLALVAALMFGALATELHRGSGVWFDGPVLGWLYGMRSPSLTTAMQTVTHLGDGIVLAVIATVASVVLAVRRHLYSGLYVAACAGGAGLLNHAMKLWFARPRPDLLLRLSSTAGYAFPSGHSTGAAALYAALAIVAITRFPKHRAYIVALCVAMVGWIGVSRAYLHVHFPSDVAAGWGVGLLWALLLKPLVLGKGFRKSTIPRAELRADGIPAANGRAPF